MKTFLAVALLGAGTALAAPGDFDRFFGQNGWAMLPPGPVTDRAVSASFVMSDSEDRILAIGNVPRPTDGPEGAVPVFARFLTDGTPDASLGGTGYYHPAPLVDASRVGRRAFPVAGGRTLLVEQRRTLCWPPRPACALETGTPFFFAQRIEPGGEIDPTYGVMATVSSDIVQEDVVAAPDGSLTVVGYQYPPVVPGAFPDRRYDVRGFDPAGQISLPWIPARPAFDCNGSNPSFGDARMARQADGRLLVAQQSTAGERHVICISRLNPDASLDTSFGSGGRFLIDDWRFISGGSPSVIHALHARSEGGAILFVEPFSLKGSRNLYVVWLTAAGALDPARGVQGVAGPIREPVFEVTAVAVQSDGRILLAGFPKDPTAYPYYESDRMRPRIARLDAFGTLDLSFGPTGEGFAPLASTTRRLSPHHIHPGDGGAIFVAGSASQSVTAYAYDRFAVVKLRGDPPPASSSGGGGGCGFIRIDRGPLDPTLPILALAAALLLVSRSRRRR